MVGRNSHWPRRVDSQLETVVVRRDVYGGVLTDFGRGDGWRCDKLRGSDMAGSTERP